MPKNSNYKRGRVEKVNKHKLNDEIKFNEVRLVGEGEPIVMKTSEALKLADQKELDLVLMSETATPPVVKIMDYAKFIYDQNKNKPQTKTKPIKVVRFTPNTDENDLAFKTKHIISFLQKGHKVKAYVFFKGREMAFKDRGEQLLLKLALELNGYATVDQMPKMEGNKMNMYFKPIEKKK